MQRTSLALIFRSTEEPLNLSRKKAIKTAICARRNPMLPTTLSKRMKKLQVAIFSILFMLLAFLHDSSTSPIQDGSTAVKFDGLKYFDDLFFIFNVTAHKIKSHWSAYFDINPYDACPLIEGLH